MSKHNWKSFKVSFLLKLNKLYHDNSSRGTARVMEHCQRSQTVISAEFAYGFYFVN